MLVMWLGMAGQKCLPIIDAATVLCPTEIGLLVCPVNGDRCFPMATGHGAEPLDVPAVQEPVESECFAGDVGGARGWICNNNGRVPKNSRTPSYMTFDGGSETIKGEGGYLWTCSDKRRVLLTGEDGTRHCVLFGGKK